jgi:hypothetical protein
MYRPSHLPGWPVVGVVLLAIVALAGCGAPQGTVSGQVKFQGQPLPAGKITFFCEGGTKPVITRDLTHGQYTMPEMPVGNARVAVATIEIKQDAVLGAMQSPTPTDVPAAATGPFVKIPDKYRMPDLSGLTYPIVAGKQTKDWDLAP